ncbi:hypothetical protein [Mycolicibacterium komossense]|uniref:Cadherin domain-containing protein n=1 Tax=Mycolicibacterium komossense TaxID=1779 RepID=A0ABT3C624_9MYCO|nr:hypothetical protein [Mycolicibacterium komossense]MCV7224912.1 hypothetical protein [Mycolicibacterium komossense]
MTGLAGTQPTTPAPLRGLGDAIAYAAREIEPALFARPVSALAASSAAAGPPLADATEPPTNSDKIAEELKSSLELAASLITFDPVAIVANLAQSAFISDELDNYSKLLIGDAVTAAVNAENAIPQVIAYLAGPNAAVGEALTWAGAAVEDAALAGVAGISAVGIGATALTVGTVGYIGYTLYKGVTNTQFDPPVAGAPSVGQPNSVTGVVTGTVVFTDDSGRSLTYTFPASSSGGGTVTFTPDATEPDTFDFTYTPTASQRAYTSLYPGNNSDTFTVTATDQYLGVSASEQVYVTIAPGPPAPNTFVGTWGQNGVPVLTITKVGDVYTETLAGSSSVYATLAQDDPDDPSDIGGPVSATIVQNDRQVLLAATPDFDPATFSLEEGVNASLSDSGTLDQSQDNYGSQDGFEVYSSESRIFANLTPIPN